MSQMALEIGLPRNQKDVVASGDVVRPSFARHETFHPRFGWLKKGFDATVANPDIFIRPDATVLLGVGKNMVRAIRYWCSAFKVTQEAPDPLRPRMRIAHPTAFGRRLLDGRGWDPYLENPASLWLLHWKLVLPPSTAPSWFASFNLFDAAEFTDQDLLGFVREFRDSQTGWSDIVDASLKKDVSCLIRMYAGGQRDQEVSSEENLDSPFVDLGLIRRTAGASGHYCFPTGAKPNLPPEVIGHVCLAYMAVHGGSARTMSVRRLAYERNSPGRVFKIGESTLLSYLESFANGDHRVSVTRVAGVAQLVSSQEPGEAAEGILTDYYARAGGRR